MRSSDLPTDTAKWTEGDPRDAKILQIVIDVTLYHLHSRINPRQIPAHRIQRRDEAIAWLKMINKADIDVDLPVLQDADGVNVLRPIVTGQTDKTPHAY